MASLVPEPERLDADLHFVLCDFGEFGPAFVETSPDNASREAIIRDILSGEYDRPLRVLALNPAEGWSRDVSHDVAQAVAMAAETLGSELTDGTRTFLEEQLDRPMHVQQAKESQSNAVERYQRS